MITSIRMFNEKTCNKTAALERAAGKTKGN